MFWPEWNAENFAFSLSTDSFFIFIYFFPGVIVFFLDVTLKNILFFIVMMYKGVEYIGFLYSELD